MALNRLPVELCRLSMTPIRLDTDYPEPPLPAMRPVSDSLLRGNRRTRLQPTACWRPSGGCRISTRVLDP